MRKNIFNRGVEPTPSSRAGDSAANAESPDRAVTSAATGGRVRVRALCHLGEEIDGEIRRFKPGDIFDLDPARAAAIGDMLEIL